MKPIPDDQLDRLGTYFVYHRVRDKRGWTFEYFVKVYLQGGWEA